MSMEQTADLLQKLASGLDRILNRGVQPPPNVFILIVSPVGDNPNKQANYITNADKPSTEILLGNVLLRVQDTPPEKMQ